LLEFGKIHDEVLFFIRVRRGEMETGGGNSMNFVSP